MKNTNISIHKFIEYSNKFNKTGHEPEQILDSGSYWVCYLEPEDNNEKQRAILKILNGQFACFVNDISKNEVKK